MFADLATFLDTFGGPAVLDVRRDSWIMFGLLSNLHRDSNKCFRTTLTKAASIRASHERGPVGATWGSLPNMAQLSVDVGNLELLNAEEQAKQTKKTWTVKNLMSWGRPTCTPTPSSSSSFGGRGTKSLRALKPLATRELMMAW